MDLFTGAEHDHVRPHMANGAYQWWYTDALSADAEWGVVVILFRGMPMSPSYLAAQRKGTGVPAHHCGYAVSIYHKGARVAFAFREIPEGDFAAPGNVIEIDTGHPDAPQRIRVRIEMLGSPLQPTGIGTHEHSWTVVAPRMPVVVELSIDEQNAERARTSWEGFGYRDSNAGEAPIQDAFGDWYWGRVQGADRTIVFMATPGTADPFFYCGEVRQGANELLPWSNLEITLSGYRPSVMGLWCARRVVITGTDADGRPQRLLCRNSRIVEDGPFYQRYLSQWTYGTEHVGWGTSEYMNAARLRRRWILPFLRLPFLRHD